MDNDHLKRFLDNIVPISPTVTAEEVLLLVVENFAFMTAFKQMSGADWPNPNVKNRELLMFQFGLTVGKFQQLMSLYHNMAGGPPSSKAWDEASAVLSQRQKNGK